MPDITVVVPCYNESRRLDQARFRTFAADHPEIGLLLVDDGSNDDTAAVLATLAHACGPHVRTLDLAPNRGKAEAVRAGLRDILAHEPQCRLLGYWDADLATPLGDIAVFAQLFADAPERQLVLGSRNQRLGSRIVRTPRRHYLGRVFATFVSQLLGLPVYDSQCGAKLMRRELAECVTTEPFLSRWFFDVEILARTIIAHGRARTLEIAYEYPLARWDCGDETRLTTLDFLRTPWELWRLHRHYAPLLRGK